MPSEDSEWVGLVWFLKSEELGNRPLVAFDEEVSVEPRHFQSSKGALHCHSLRKLHLRSVFNRQNLPSSRELGMPRRKRRSNGVCREPAQGCHLHSCNCRSAGPVLGSVGRGDFTDLTFSRL